VHRLAGKIISSLPRWLLITMMIMVILTRDLACCRRPPVWRGHHRFGLLHLARPRSAGFGDVEHGASPPGYRQTMISWTGPVLMIGCYTALLGNRGGAGYWPPVSFGPC
jgi:hypothetical protein